MFGAGRYDDFCTKVREETHADGAVVIVFNGKDGHGFSVQAPLELTKKLPFLLRLVADDIEKDFSELGTHNDLA